MLPGETVMSWVARFGRDQTGLEPEAFLALIGLSCRRVLDAAPGTLDRLAEVTGTSQDRIAEGACRATGEGCFEHRGERFHSGFAPRRHVTFCVSCLREDSFADSPSRGRPVGRINWLFSPVRTCPVHLTPLVRTVTTAPAWRFRDPESVVPGDAAPDAAAAGTIRRDVSPLQSYVETRLGGGTGPAWLDGQDIEQASKTCEMLGAALRFGVKAKVRDLSEDARDAAGAAGFAFAARGEDGIREALDLLLRRFREAGTKGGPQAAFGLIYHWLQFQRSGKAKGPVEGLARAFILETMAVEPGAVIFGEAVPTRRRHSVASLARQTKLHPKTLNRALVAGRVLPEADPDRVDGFLSFDAAAGEAIAERLMRSVPVVGIPGYLNCHRTQAEALMRAGLLGGTGARTSRSGSMLDMAETVDLKAFLDRFLSSGRPVTAAGEGMMNVIAAAKVSRWPVVDIVRLVLDGGLERVEIDRRDRKFRSVLVDPDEVRRVLDARMAKGRLTIVEAAGRLGLQTGGIRALMSGADRNGRPFLTAVTETNGNGAPRHFFEASDLGRFAAAHVDLRQIAQERGTVPKILRGRLSAAGIEPILPRARLGR